VTLIGFQDQGNLGIGYLAATLSRHGFSVDVLDFRQGDAAILESVQSTDPLLVGFSLIFQYYLPQFAHLASHLRDHGITSHFCAGGHYPSLRSRHLLTTVPALDSVVRCEGEKTLAELTKRLAEGLEWRDVLGIAYRVGGECIATAPRPLMQDLDELPYPERPLESLAVLGKSASPLLASRGCARSCTFCSIRQFYTQSPGKRVRVRSAESVVGEMKALREERGTSIFLFQDDDFPLWGRFGREWVGRFIDAIESNDLMGRVIWKVSCRADEVEPDLFLRMRDAGLYMVYLGLESGTPTGLQALNKQLNVEDNLRAVTVLNELKIAVAYGFMLFDPTSTFESVRANIQFLRKIGVDGTLPVVFCRMLPYAGTPIEEQLDREGRLRGDLINPDYDFLDPRLNGYFNAIHSLVADWVQGQEGLSTRLGWAWQEYWVMRRLFPPLPGLDAYARSLRAITRSSNEFILDLVEDTSRTFEDGGNSLPLDSVVRDVSRAFADQMLSQRNSFVLRNQDVMLASVS
jgi:radical SAM superfamily enzyme YgiQ (UPF0313 family)